jgi:ParB/RepB/Spo0J family partition protein
LEKNKTRKEPIYAEIPLSQISDDTYFMNRSSLEVEDLRKSIAQIGQQVPVILRRKGPFFQTISGFRRTEAVRLEGHKTIKAIIYDELPDVEAHKVSLAENIQQKSLTQLELVNTCKKLKDENLKTEDICKAFGKKLRTIQRYLVVADAEAEIKKALSEDRITILQAYEIIKRKIKLTDFLTNKLSIRRLRQMSERPKSKINPIKIQWFKNGNMNLTVRFRKHLHNKSELIKNLRQITSKLSENEMS